MGKQGSPQRRQLLVRLEPPEPPEALGGLLHGGSGPTERHPGVPPAFDVSANLPDGPVHVLDDVGAGQRPAQFDRQSKAGDGEDFVDPLQDAAGNAGIVMFQAAGQVFDQAFGLVGVIQFPRLSQRFADTGVKGLGKTIRDVAGLVDLTALDRRRQHPQRQGRPRYTDRQWRGRCVCVRSPGTACRNHHGFCLGR